MTVNGVVSNSYFAGNPKIHSKFQKVVVELPTYPNNAKAFYHSDNNTIFVNVSVTEYSFSISK